jgi:hypothetical protein
VKPARLQKMLSPTRSLVCLTYQQKLNNMYEESTRSSATLLSLITSQVFHVRYSSISKALVSASEILPTMPNCAICNVHFPGRGRYCHLHIPCYQSTYNADIYSPLVRYHGRSCSVSRPCRHRQIGYKDTWNALETYRSNAAINDYNYPYIATCNESITHPAVTSYLNATLEHFSDTHAISSLTYTISPSGAHSVTATANPDREQCRTCCRVYANAEKLQNHKWEFPFGCERHRVCLRQGEVYAHAMARQHDKWFVRGCESLLRREGDWPRGEVERHVSRWHVW